MKISEYPISKKASKNGKDLIKEAAQLEISRKDDFEGHEESNKKAKARELELVKEGHALVAASLGICGEYATVDLFWSNKEWTRKKLK